MRNIRELLNNLRNNQWHITAFQFTYKEVQYIVLFEDISNLKLVADGYLVLLTFIDRTDGMRIFQTKANTFKFSAKAQEFREYFGIQYAFNLGDVFQQFYTYFGNFVPTRCIQEFDLETKRAVLNRLSHNDGENINNLCCYAAKRNGVHNGVQYHRTPFNSDKTRLLRNNLFNMLGNDDTISFCYREENPLDDTEIYAQFSQHYDIR